VRAPAFPMRIWRPARVGASIKRPSVPIAAIKNLPVLFAKQANIAHGPQQVNNGAPLPARTENATIAPNELLEAHAVTRLDTGATAAAGAGDPSLATVGTIDGTAYI